MPRGWYFRNVWMGMCCWDPGTLALLYKNLRPPSSQSEIALTTLQPPPTLLPPYTNNYQSLLNLNWEIQVR